MTDAPRGSARLAVLMRAAAAASALALLPAGAGAFTLVNDIAARLTYNLYDQTDFIMAVPCYQQNMDNKGQRQWPGFPESCAGRIKLKVKVDIGGVSCTGEQLTPSGAARISGTTTSCSVTVAP